MHDSNSGVLEQEGDFPSIMMDDDSSLSTGSLEQDTAQKSKNRLVFATLLISVIALLGTLAWPLLSGQIYTADDLSWFHLPMRSFYSQQLVRGEAFDWNPDLYCGFYLTGEGQVGSYHPLHWLLYRTLPLSIAFDLECWLTYPLMLVGMYMFLRRWKLQREAAGFGAMVFTFGSFNLLHFFHLNGVAIVAHLPWLLWAVDIMLRPSSSAQKQNTTITTRRLAFCGVALLTASQLLLGYPQYVFFSLAVEAGYALFISISPQHSSRNMVAGFSRWLFAGLLGVLIGVVQLLPTYDALQNSVRQTNTATDFATQGSLPLLNLMQLVTPYLFANRAVGGITHEFGLYIGAIPFVLAVWWVFGASKSPKARRLTVAALATAGISLLWMMGELGPLGWLQEHLPLLNKFRLPCRAIVVFELSLSVLASLGFADLLWRKKNQALPNFDATTNTVAKDRRQFLWALPLISAIFTLIALGFWFPYVGTFTLVALGPVLMTVAVCLVLRATSGARWALAAMIAITAIDLGAYGMSYSVFGHTEPLSKLIATIDTPLGIPPQRVALDLANGSEAAPGQKKVRVGDQIVLAGWRRLDGYAGLDPAKQLDYHLPTALRRAGVTWLTTDVSLQLASDGHTGWLAKPNHRLMVPSEPVVAMGKGSIWFRMANPQPKAWLVNRTIPSDNPAADIANISLSDEALVEKSVSPLTLNKNADPADSKDASAVTMHADRPGFVSLTANCATQQFLVVNESYHSGWKATVDNQSVSLVRANGDFMGVTLGPGQHEIALKFEPKSLQCGRLASAFGLGLMVVVLGITVWPKNRRHS